MKPGTLVMYTSPYGPHMRSHISRGDVGLVEEFASTWVTVQWLVAGKRFDVYPEEIEVVAEPESIA